MRPEVVWFTEVESDRRMGAVAGVVAMWAGCYGFVRPETEPKFVLRRNRRYTRYESLAKCFVHSAMKGVSEGQQWLDNMTALDAFQRALNNSGYNVKKEPLTHDEVLAIYIYSCSTPLRVDRMFTEQLKTGDAGNWNCFLDYLFSAMDKIRGSDEKNKTVYRGIYAPEYDKSVWDTMLRNGEFASMDSFTSSSVEQRVAAVYSKDHVIVNIHNMGQKPKYITPYAHLNTEMEFLWPPGCRFRVIREPYYLKCELNESAFNCENVENGTDFRFVDLEDITDSEEYRAFEWYGDAYDWRLWLIMPAAALVLCLIPAVFMLAKRNRRNQQFERIAQ